MTFLSSYSMKTQLLAYTTIILAIFSTLVYFAEYIAAEFILDAFVTQSDYIFDKTSQSSISYTTSYVQYLNLYFQISNINLTVDSNPLIIFSKLYLTYLNILKQNHLSEQFNFGGIHPLPSVLTDSNPQMTYSTLCYSFKEEANHSNFSQLQQITFEDFLAPMGQIVYSDIQGSKPLLYGYLISSPKSLSSYPCFSYGQDFDEYHPETRPWFDIGESMIEDMLHNLEYGYNVSDPYLFASTDTVGITLVLPQLNHKLQFEGVWCADLFLEYIAKRSSDMIQNYDIKIVIVTESGLIVPANETHSKTPVYFYDTNLTGYDLEDWQLLQNRQNIFFHFYNHLINDEGMILKLYLEKQQMFVLLQLSKNYLVLQILASIINISFSQR